MKLIYYISRAFMCFYVCFIKLTGKSIPVEP